MQKERPCTAGDYVVRIYADKTRLPNAFRFSCPFETSGAIAAKPCCALEKNDFVAKADYFYQEPESYVAYKNRDKQQNSNVVVAKNKADGLSCQTRHCGIEPACPASTRADLFYNPNTSMEPVRTLPGRFLATDAPFRPATSFPVLDRFNVWDPVTEKPYCFASANDAGMAIAGIQDGFVVAREKFNRTSFQEQVDVWNRLIGVDDAHLSTWPTSRLCNLPSWPSVECKPVTEMCDVTPVPYYFSYTDFKQ